MIGCPACDGYGYNEGDGEPECDVCDGDGVTTHEAVARWEARMRHSEPVDPIQRWVDELCCAECGSLAGDPCLLECSTARAPA